MASAEHDFVAKAAASIILGVVAIVLLSLWDVLVWKPRSLRRKLEKQGIRGPPPQSFFLGNIPDMERITLEAKRAADTSTRGEGFVSHDWPSVGFSYIWRWREEFGNDRQGAWIFFFLFLFFF